MELLSGTTGKMGTQLDSINISQLKADALSSGVNYIESDSRDLRLGTWNSRTHENKQDGTGLSGPVADETSAPQSRRPPHFVNTHARSVNPQSGLPGHNLRHAASQPDLPSTIPESVRSKMTSTSSQSQGDTQPVSQWVLEEVKNRNKARREESDALQESERSYQGSTPRAIQQGQSGHINLLEVFEQAAAAHPEDLLAENDDNDIDPLSQPIDVRADIFPESKRFQLPKSPASHGTKRKRGINTSPQKVQSPSLPINPFAGQTDAIEGIMGPSQLFNTTQALTSPLANVIHSDGLSERPSPHMYDAQRPLTADPPSSPAVLRRSNMLRAVTEPQVTYISMKESQEAREKQMAQMAERVLPDESSDDDGFGSMENELQRRLNYKKMRAEVMDQFAGVTTRSNQTTRGVAQSCGGRLVGTPGRVTPFERGKVVSKPVIISDDAQLDDTQANTTEDETEREEEVDVEDLDDTDELAEENKENIEVPRTVPRLHHSTSQVVSSQPTPLQRKLPRPRQSPSSQTKNAARIQSSRSQEVLRSSGNGTQLSRVADSQPSPSRVVSRNASALPGTRAASEPRSSLDSRLLVPQSQSTAPSRPTQALSSQGGTHDGRSSSQKFGGSPSRKLQAHQLRAKSTSAGNDDSHIAHSPTSPTIGENQTVLKLQVTPSPPEPQNDSPQGTDRPASSSQIERSPTLQKTYNQPQITNESSNSMPSPMPTLRSTTKNLSGNSMAEQSRASTIYETAKENLASPQSGNQVQRVQQETRGIRTPPGKSKLLRTISDIAAYSSPRNAIGDVDVDINILSNEDVEFQSAMDGSSPLERPSKQRKLGQGHAVPAAQPEAPKLPILPHSPLVPPSSAYSVITPVHTSSEPDVRSPTTTGTTRVCNGGVDAERAAPSVRPFEEQGAIAAPPFLPGPLETVPQPRIVRSRSSKRPASPLTTDNPHPQGGAGYPNQSSVTAPNRVFAHFNGQKPAYHPATCLEEIGGGEPRYRVRFDDGTVDTISAYGIKTLELKIGDVLKVDLPGARTKSYVVEGMRDQQRSTVPPDPSTPSRRGYAASTNDSAFPEVDIYGFATVLVSQRQRTSTDGTPSENQQIAVPLAQVYFTQTMWTGLKNRQYRHAFTKMHMHTLTGLQTPSEQPSTPSTPSSRTRRAKNFGLASSRPLPANARNGDGIFRNMAFAITNVDRDEDSARVKHHILSNGGQILNSGFDELFHIPALDRTTTPTEADDGKFRLTPAAQDVGFTCLIADGHCRRAKFVQALALGIPCLATRWILDCVAKQRVLAWQPYLLPAGESAYLGGIVRSRILPPFAADTTKLSDMINARPKLLEDASVLLVMEPSQETTMKQHPLITHALGASMASRAMNVDAAVKAVADAHALGTPWEWVFSYDKEDELERKFSGGGTTGKKRKRGRESDGYDGGSRKKVKTKVVGNESVIQSLILGMLVD